MRDFGFKGSTMPILAFSALWLVYALAPSLALSQAPLAHLNKSPLPDLPGLDPDLPIKASTIEIEPGIHLRARPLADRHDECQNCHMQKSFNKIPDKKKTTLEHDRFDLRHGKKVISCNFCHDKNKHNFLRSSKMSPTSFANTSGVCRQCHAENYRGWSEGLHGKRIGGWNNTQIQLHCIDCHDPHDVSFKKMQARPEPPLPRFAIPKTSATH